MRSSLHSGILCQLWEASAICEENLLFLELDIKQLGTEEDCCVAGFLFLIQGCHVVTGKIRRTTAVTYGSGGSSLNPSGHGFLGSG